jgi:ABC-type transporter Mla subunit MlaD
MKSCLGVLFTLLVLIAVIGGGAWLWYLSSTTQITRKAPPAAVEAPAVR